MLKKILLKATGIFGIGIALCFFPILLEILIKNIGIHSGFKEDVWFSFWGSYAGAIATIVVLYITLKKNRNFFNGQIEMQRKIREIDDNIDKTEEVIKVIGLSKYTDSNDYNNVDCWMSAMQEILECQIRIYILMTKAESYRNKTTFHSKMYKTSEELKEKGIKIHEILKELTKKQLPESAELHKEIEEFFSLAREKNFFYQSDFMEYIEVMRKEQYNKTN